MVGAFFVQNMSRYGACFRMVEPTPVAANLAATQLVPNAIQLNDAAARFAFWRSSANFN
jgi:hypothetical protein